MFANLECTLQASIDDAENFRAPSTSAETLATLGFTHLHLANNHVLEAGAEGLEDTLLAVGSAGMEALGAGPSQGAAKRLRVDEVLGLRIGWLACGRTLVDQGADKTQIWELDEAELQAAVSEGASAVDVLVVSIHIGFMLVEYPSPGIRALAHRLCEAGAHLILMHHPHVLQGVEIVGDNRAICYSLGNLLFDWREGRFPAEILIEEQNEGALFFFDLDADGVARVSVAPTYIEDRCRVLFAQDERAERIVDRVKRLSRELEGDYVPLFERQRAAHNTGLAARTLWHHLKRGELFEALRLSKRVRPHHFQMLIRWLFQPTDSRPSS